MASNILVVEDSSTTRSLIISYLELVVSYMEDAENFQFFEASNGFEALKLLPHHKFALIITDINMPNINGLELVSFIKKSEVYSHIPIIILTTEGSKKDIEKGISLGASEYIVKPFEPEVLHNAVKKHLKR